MLDERTVNECLDGAWFQRGARLTLVHSEHTAASAGASRRHSTSPGTPAGAVTARIRGHVPTLSRTGAAVATIILAEPRAVIHMTISDLAARSGTSVGSVVRFCQDLGFRGFQDLKLAIASDGPAAAVTSPADSETMTSGVLHDVLTSSACAIAEVASTLDLAAFESATTTLSGARSVLVLGVGTSSPLASDAAYRLRMIGVRADAPSDPHAQHLAAALSGRGDVCLAVSHTGQTRETLQAVGAAQDAGASTIAVTSFFRSPLTELCDTSLVAGSAETKVRIEAMASRFAHLAILDALSAAVGIQLADHARAASATAADVITAHRL